MTERHLKELAATDTLDTARRRRYEALSAALAAGHPQHAVGAAAGMSPPSLSRNDPPRHRPTLRPPVEALTVSTENAPD